MITQYMDIGLFLPLDVYFAESLLKREKGATEAQKVFLAFLLALSRQGHLALPLSQLESLVKILAGSDKCDTQELMELVQLGALSLPATLIADAVSEGKPIIKDQDCYYLQKHWMCECEIASRLYELQNTSVLHELPEIHNDLNVNAQQSLSIAKAWQHPLSILIGGPGTGKTYTAACFIKALLSCEQSHEMRIAIAAPTGKAVGQLDTYLKRFLPEDTHWIAGTLHTLLGLRREEDYEKSPSPLFADVVIVDECSMIDARLFSRLLFSVMRGSRLILIGDPDQLPSVEAGSIFSDLVNAARNGVAIPLTELKECLRSDRKDIHVLAESIRQGDITTIENIWMHNSLRLQEQCKYSVYQTLFNQYRHHFPAFFHHEPTQEELMRYLDAFRLLSCMRQGTFGVDAINHYFFSKFMQNRVVNSWWVIPILITKNDYALELYNGDTGFLIRKMEIETPVAKCSEQDYAIFSSRTQGGCRKIPALALPAYEWGYCLSVHKSQGSEYDEVVILIPHGSEVFGREVLYTAVTRARHTVTCIGDIELIQKLIQNSSRKISGLSARIKKMMEEIHA